MKLAHVRVVPNEPTQSGRPQIVMKDKIVAVCDDGTEVDISSAVNAWSLISNVGEVRLLELTIICHVMETSEIGADVQPSPSEDA